MKIDFSKFDPTNFKTLFLFSLLWRWLVFTVAIIGYFILPEQYAPLSLIGSPWNKNFIFWSWANFDTEHFFHIAEFGYGYNRGLPTFSFFPLYPLLLRAGKVIFFNYFIAGQAIILFFLPLALYFFNSFLKEREFSDRKIWLTDLLFLFSAGGVFLNAFYTELPFILFALASLYFLPGRKYFLAGILALLASATRVVGIFLAPAIFWQLFGDRQISWFKKISLTVLSGGGLFLYSLFLGLRFGNPLLFGLAHQSWGKAQIVSPIKTLINYSKTVFLPPETLGLFGHYTVVIEFLVTITALTGLVYLWLRAIKKKLVPPMLIFSTLAFILPFLTGSLGTMPRYLLTFFSLFPLGTEIFLKVKPWFRYCLTIVVVFVFVSGVVLFTRGYWWG